MSSRPLDVPPYQLQPLIDSVIERFGNTDASAHVRCAQALGSEIYVGCSNGELLRFALQTTNTTSPDSYTLLSRQSVLGEKPIDEIVLVPSISRALVLSDRQVHFYTLPALDVIPSNMIKPLRNVVTFAVDEQHLRRPLPPQSQSEVPIPVDPIEFCVVKRNEIALYSLRDRLFFQKAIPLPSGGTHARRTGKVLCLADKEFYNMVDLDAASLIQLLPLSQDMTSTVPVKPFITVVGENEFLILSWTGYSTMGVFITGEGDPVRGTLEWPMHPAAVCLDYPYITALLPNKTIEIHSIETQAIVYVVPAPVASPPSSPTPGSRPSAGPDDRKVLVGCPNGFFVPSSERATKLRTVPVRLVRETHPEEVKENAENAQQAGQQVVTEEVAI